jgi:hypothetical protein
MTYVLHPDRSTLAARFSVGAFLGIGEVLLAFLRPSTTMRMSEGEGH